MCLPRGVQLVFGTNRCTFRTFRIRKCFSSKASKQVASLNMARALLVADPLLAATSLNDASEAPPGQASDRTLAEAAPTLSHAVLCMTRVSVLAPAARRRGVRAGPLQLRRSSICCCSCSCA